MVEPTEPLWVWTAGSSGAGPSPWHCPVHASAFFASYEVQLESKVRRKGLGKFLIQILQLMANR